MNKLFVFSVILVIFTFLFVSCEKEDDFNNENFNEFIIGSWEINGDENDNIVFYEEGFFIINDEIFGNFWVDEENIREIKYICDGEDETSIMKFKRYIGSYRSIVVDNLPLHEGESHLTKKLEE